MYRTLRTARQGALFVCVLACVLSTRPVMAHDFWIEAAPFQPQAGSEALLILRIGEDFAGDALINVPELIKRFAVLDARGTHAVEGEPGDDPAGRLRNTAPGRSVVIYESRAYDVELPPEKFQKYLTAEGLDHVLAERKRRGEEAKPARERYFRYAKAILSTGGKGGQFNHDFGMRLELIPERDPYAIAREARLPARLLFNGKPIAGVLVQAFRREEPEKKLRARTDAMGRVTLAISEPGTWLIKAVHMQRLPAGQMQEWESYWASLTFEIPRK
jgi:hypothetical protein